LIQCTKYRNNRISFTEPYAIPLAAVRHLGFVLTSQYCIR